MVVYFTSITANYFAKARVLGMTLKRHNPQAKFVVVMSDPLPEYVNIAEEPMDEIIQSETLDLGMPNDIFFFIHTITELCTAVKPVAAQHIMDRYNADGVIYLDPDIAVFDSLNELEGMFNEASILLTPHQTKPEEIDFYVPRHEILVLKRGTFNFGFFGVKNDENGRAFLAWWAERLKYYCFDDNYDLLPELTKAGLLGLFTDQKWGDLIPSLFDNVKIIKEPGYNVCTWNLTTRTLEVSESGNVFIDGKKLYFFHFSGFDSGGHENELQILLRDYPKNEGTKKLSAWYTEQLSLSEQEKFERIEFNRNYYDNGEKIQNFERKLLHMRHEVFDYPEFKNPFAVTSGFCVYSWLRSEYGQWFSRKQRKKAYFCKNKTLERIVNICFPAGSRRREILKILLKR